MKVLLIEDNAADLVLTKAKIEKHWPELELYAASSMHETYEMAKTQSFDLILLDLNLPDGHGVRSVAEVKRYIDPTPIAVLTGHIDSVIERESIKAGAEAVISKNSLMNEGFEKQLGTLLSVHAPKDEKTVYPLQQS